MDSAIKEGAGRRHAVIKALFAAGLLATLPLAFGQSAHPLVGRDVAVPSARFPAEWYPKQNGDSTDAPIAGAPYSATWTMTTTLLNSEGKPGLPGNLYQRDC